MRDDDSPACPWCASNRRVYPSGHRNWVCLGCRREFDGIDDGDVGYGRPEKRLEREERRQERQKARKT